MLQLLPLDPLPMILSLFIYPIYTPPLHPPPNSKLKAAYIIKKHKLYKKKKNSLQYKMPLQQREKIKQVISKESARIQFHIQDFHKKGVWAFPSCWEEEAQTTTPSWRAVYAWDNQCTPGSQTKLNHGFIHTPQQNTQHSHPSQLSQVSPSPYSRLANPLLHSLLCWASYLLSLSLPCLIRLLSE